MSKKSGIARRLDELGRIVLPVEMRRALDIEERDAIDITMEGNKIILQKYQPNCVFCGSNLNLITYMDKPVCSYCIKKLEGEASEK